MSTDTIVLPKRKADRQLKERSSEKPPRDKQPPYHVILLNDDDHTYDYVVNMLAVLFGHPPEKAVQMAKEVDGTGRVIVDTTTKERAELKRDQIHAFGPDSRVTRCAGSMSATIEPAISGDDEDE